MSSSVLIITNHPANIKNFQIDLKKKYYQLSIASDSTEALELINNTDLDTILLDFNMLEMCNLIKPVVKAKKIPVILFFTDEHSGVMELLNNVDSLTNIHNRNYFDSKITKFYDEAIKNNSDLSLVIMDMDFFKNINDTHGHLVGDEMLKKIGKVIRDSVRNTDLLVRFGGDEFALALPSID